VSARVCVSARICESAHMRVLCACACVCVRVRVRVCACARVRVRARARACACACACACAYAYAYAYAYACACASVYLSVCLPACPRQTKRVRSLIQPNHCSFMRHFPLSYKFFFNEYERQTKFVPCDVLC